MKEYPPKHILLLINVRENNRDAYIHSMVLAKKCKATLTIFTTVAQKSEKNLYKIYSYLLELEGYYQTNYNNWQTNPISAKREIGLGSLVDSLLEYLDEFPVDYIVFNDGGLVKVRSLA